MIKLKLMKNGDTMIYLTDNTIKNINFISAKTDEIAFLKLTRDIELFIRVENANIYELYGQKSSEGEEEALPREIDSVRDLLNYSLALYDNEYSYLDGEIETIDGLTQSVSKFSFKDLFVLRFEERFAKDTKDTNIYVLLREKAR